MKNLHLSIYALALCFLMMACQSAKKEDQTQGGEKANSTEQTGSEQPLPSGDKGKAAANANSKRIIFFGNSLSAGYGLENPELAFPALVQQKIDAAGYDFEVVNAGLSGETTAGGRNRIDWVLKQPVSVLVLELGGNDGLRGIDSEESIQNLQAIIDATLSKYPKATVVLAGMEAPPNMGEEYTQGFREMYTSLAEKNNLPLIPFLLEGVAGEADLNLPDGIHPNPEGHKLVAENVWEVLQPILAEKAGAS